MPIGFEVDGSRRLGNIPTPPIKLTYKKKTKEKESDSIQGVAYRACMNKVDRAARTERNSLEIGCFPAVATVGTVGLRL